MLPVYCIIILSYTTVAQVLPIPNAVLNYTQILFEYNQVPKADKYAVIITNTKTKQKHAPIYNTSLAVIYSKGIVYNTSYQWYVIAYNNNKVIHTSTTYAFSTLGNNLTHTSSYTYKVTVLDTSKLTSTSIVLLDNVGVAINKQGKVVWYLPRNTDAVLYKDSSRRSLRVSPTGSFTYLDQNNCYDKNIQGNTLWQAPNTGAVSGDSVEHYHHDFRKLSNGTYLCTGYKYVLEPNYYKPTAKWKMRYNTLIQYDSTGKIIWSWNEKDYLTDAILYENGDASMAEYNGSHLNGFDVDEAKKQIIISLRNTNRILMIDYTTKEVQYELGRYDSTSHTNYAGAYTLSNQHGPCYTQDGNILVYDNNYGKLNEARKASNPIIRLLAPPSTTLPDYQVWAYECKSDSFAMGQQGKEGYAMPTALGNSYLVCQGSTHRVFEVNQNKKITWEAFCYNYNHTLKQWLPYSNYRAYSASSLYPLHFTLQYNNYVQRQVIINNEGTLTQSYYTEEYDNNGTLLIIKQYTIPPRSYAQHIPTYGTTTKVSVYPTLNRRLVRTMQL